MTETTWRNNEYLSLNHSEVVLIRHLTPSPWEKVSPQEYDKYQLVKVEM